MEQHLNDKPTLNLQQAVPLSAEAFLAEPYRLWQTLEAQGTLTFTPYASGLFPASDLTPEMAKATGQGMAWLRDNAHVINALHETGRDALAVPAGKAVLKILTNNSAILESVGNGDSDRRLPVRVEGNTLENDNEPRIQNDSVGYALWSAGRLMEDGAIEPTEQGLHTLAQTVRYLEKIQYWHDADDGHWEEEGRIHTSSIGVVVAGLRTAQRVFNLAGYSQKIDINALVTAGQDTTQAIFARGVTDVGNMAELTQKLPQPAEILPDTVTPHDRVRDYIEGFSTHLRRHDAALLFLVEPLQTLDDALARTVVNDIEKHLLREHGIARYEGDTYWEPRFKDIMTIEERTTKTEGRTDQRNRTAAGIAYSGTEAQWTLFDPLLSVYWGKEYIKSQCTDKDAREKQLAYLNRSLGQLIPGDKAGLRMPEAYYYEYTGMKTLGSNGNEWISNDHMPLLWSQANLLLALKTFEESAFVIAN